VTDLQQCARCGETPPTANATPAHPCPHGQPCHLALQPIRKDEIACDRCELARCNRLIAQRVAREDEIKKAYLASLPGAREALLRPVAGIAGPAVARRGR
jgi:hypothetical protein